MYLLLPLFLSLGSALASETAIIGSKDFIHVEKSGGVWWLVDADGERFIATGMNHIGASTRFADYNRDYWMEAFGDDLFNDAGINWQGEAARNWMRQVAKDHKAFGFNTIPFHYDPQLPGEYFEELGIHYMGKIKTGEINQTQVQWHGGYADVFSPEWKALAEERIRDYIARHRNNRHLLGYTYGDLPDYSMEAYLQRYEWRMKLKDVYVIHPWIIDTISKPGLTEGKKVWLEVLKLHYSSARDAGADWGARVTHWEEFGDVTEWTPPGDREKGFAVMRTMNMRQTEAWLKTHHDLIRKYDPHHLVLGDKISAHGPGHPDWVFDMVSKYVDVVLVQDFDFYTPQHELKLLAIHEKTGKPVINGDHSYGTLRPKMKRHKGIPVENMTRVGEEYARYLEGISRLPFIDRKSVV